MRPVMARRNVEMMKEADDAITRGAGNVFADLGYADADERQTKLRLAHAINGVIARRRLSQAAAAEKLGVNPQPGPCRVARGADKAVAPLSSRAHDADGTPGGRRRPSGIRARRSPAL